MENNSFNFNSTNYNQFNKDLMNEKNFINQLNDLKAILQKKEYELNTINSLYQELKKLNEKLRRECEDLNKKNILLINDKTSIMKKYEEENKNLESEYKAKIVELELQIKNFSSNVNEISKIRNENDYKNEYEEKIFSKDKDILEKNQIIEELKNEILLSEEKTRNEKELILRDINTMKNLHKTETDDLLQRIQLLKESKGRNGSCFDDSRILNFKNDLENAKNQINLLTNENYKLKRENESLLKEKNDLKTNNKILDDKLKFEMKKNELELKRLNINISNLKLENNSLTNEIKQNEKKIKDYLLEKKNLKNDILNKESECQQLQNEINVLNNLLKKYQDEFDNNLANHYKIQNEIILKERKKEEKYKKQIENLNIKLNENINIDDYEEIINNKDEEIAKLKKKIREIENDSLVDAKLMKQYKDVVKKKNYYKSQCKLANENIGKIIDKLTPEQKKEFQNIFNSAKDDNIIDISQSGKI